MLALRGEIVIFQAIYPVWTVGMIQTIMVRLSQSRSRSREATRSHSRGATGHQVATIVVRTEWLVDAAKFIYKDGGEKW